MKKRTNFAVLLLVTMFSNAFANDAITPGAQDGNRFLAELSAILGEAFKFLF